MADPLVTIGIPFYNAEKYLLDAIKSVFSQTYQNWELILIDDGSTDDSLDIAKSIFDPRVRVISDGKNKKLPARLNEIVGLAKGKYIARMDADDLCSPTRIRQQVDLLEKDKKIDVVGCGIIYLSKADEPLGHSIAPREHEEICKRPYRTFGICHASVVARKTWYEKHRYDETMHLCEDFNLWLRSYRESKFANIPEPLYYYRLESSFNLKKQCRDRHTSAASLFEYYNKLNRPDKALFYSLTQYARLGAEIGLCVIGLKRELLARRYTRLTDTQYESYISELRKIKSTRLPIRFA